MFGQLFPLDLHTKQIEAFFSLTVLVLQLGA